MTAVDARPLVLTVDDEPGILRLITLELTEQGFNVIVAANGQEALSLVDEQRPDVVLLDIIMPGIAGLEILNKLRERWTDLPVIFVTAKVSDLDKVRGLESGADDYVVKPFNPDELAARIRAVLRRSSSSPHAGAIVCPGDLEIDLAARQVTRQGEPVVLTRIEWLLLQQLAANAGRTLLSSELLTRVWGPEYKSDFQYLRVWIYRLRRKLGDDSAEPHIIQTRHGIGYVLNASPAMRPAS